LLQIDKELAPFTLDSLEQQYKMQLPVTLNGKNENIWVGGKIDRVDRVNGKLRILDYKTGNVEAFSFKTLEELFRKDVKKPKKEILQALIYTAVLHANRLNEMDFQPVIYSLRKFFSDSHNPEIQWDKKDFSFPDLKDEFLEELKMLTEEILSPENVFSQTTHEEKCQYCPYNKICQRF